MPDLPPHTSVKTYSSEFPDDENPVSQGGIWINGLTEGIDWADVVTSNGRIHGGPTRTADRRKKDWTAGCIAVSDEEMEEIWSMVPTGIPITILA